jgi:hypothetical protein
MEVERSCVVRLVNDRALQEIGKPKHDRGHLRATSIDAAAAAVSA